MKGSSTINCGIPPKIISNCNPQLMSDPAKKISLTLGLTQNISTAYYPQTDGQSEYTSTVTPSA